MKPLNSLLVIGFTIVAAFSSLQLKAFTLYYYYLLCLGWRVRIVKILSVKGQVALFFCDSLRGRKKSWASLDAIQKH